MSSSLLEVPMGQYSSFVRLHFSFSYLCGYLILLAFCTIVIQEVCHSLSAVMWAWIVWSILERVESD